MIVDTRISQITFLVSLIGHSLIIGVPFMPQAFLPQIQEQKINLQITIEKPELIPDIKQLAQQIKIKELTPQPETKDLKETLSENAAPLEPVKVLNPQNEAMLRYQDMVKRNIQEAKKYPEWAKKQGFEGISYVVFLLLANGEIKGARIAKSSGFAVLDKEAVATVNRASPFKPIPDELNSTAIAIEVSLAFEIE